MRIVFFRHSLLSRGGDKMVVAHASHLAASGHIVTIKTNLVKTVFDVDRRVRIESLLFPGKIGTLFSAAFEKHEADLIIADIIPLLCLLLLRNRRQVIYFAQDYDESYYSSLMQKLFIRALYFLGLLFLKIPAIVVADHLGELLKCRFGAQVEVVQNGVDTSIFYPDVDSGRVVAKAGRQAILILSRSDLRKGFDIAVKVVENLPERLHASLEIWTVGEKSHGTFLGMFHHDFGYVNEERLRQIMSSADLFLYPSRHEGFPLMVMEAFACRCPVVTTKAVPYAVHNINALVSKIDDVESLTTHVCTLLSSDELKGKLAEEGYEYSQRHTLIDAQRGFELKLTELRMSYD